MARVVIIVIPITVRVVVGMKFGRGRGEEWVFSIRRLSKRDTNRLSFLGLPMSGRKIEMI